MPTDCAAKAAFWNSAVPALEICASRATSAAVSAVDLTQATPAAAATAEAAAMAWPATAACFLMSAAHF
ncbi:hypothetical protein D9M71_740160 [compost metagenome]